MRILIETEDEYARRGNFLRVFPSNNTKKYLKFFETTRYYNLLLNEWITKFRKNHEKGSKILILFQQVEMAHEWSYFMLKL